MLNIIDQEAIDNVNWAMISGLIYANKMFGKEYVIEDGKITEIHSFDRIIKGE